VRAFSVFLAVGLMVYWPIFTIRPLRGDNFYVMAWVHDAPVTALWRLDPGIYPEWRPLAYQSIWIEHQILQLSSVAIHHFVNLLLWAACAYLVFRIVERLTASRPAAYAAGLMPFLDVRANEALTWIVERQTLMACAFGLLAVATVVRRGDEDLRGGEPAGVGLALLAAALGKEHGLAFAAVLALYGLWHARRRLAMVSLTAVAVYAALRVVAAGGALGPYCEDMGFLRDGSFHCVDPASISSQVQMVYNAAASTIGTLLPGLFADSGELNLQPVRLLRNLFWLSLAVTALCTGGRFLRMLVLIVMANGLLNFMLYRERNQLIGVCALAIVAGVGAARVTMPEWRLLRPAAARLVVAAIIAALLMFRAVDAHRQVGHVASELLNQEPCLSSWRAHDFGEAFVPVVKGRYGMDNPRCEDE
jgi:hypothetical protein